MAISLRSDGTERLLRLRLAAPPLRLALLFLLGLWLIGCAATTAGREAYQLGLEHYDQGQYRAALAAFEQALATDPENPQYQKAVSDVKAAIAARSGGEGPPVPPEVAEIAARAGREAAETGKPVYYDSTDGVVRVEAEPLASADPRCRRVKERMFRGGELIQEQIREICEE